MKHFKISEFDSKCGNGPAQRYMDKTHLKMIDKARDLAGVPFHVNSGYRTPAHNKRVGAVSDSAHTRGMASDIRAVGSRERYHIIRGMMQAGFNRIGIAKTFIHCDNDPSKDEKVIWFY